jgi:uncharacterized protein (DUF305 family)
MRINTVALIAIASVSFAASTALAQMYMHRSPAERALPCATGCMGMMHDMQISSEFDYLSQMIPHHQEAVEAARQVLERSDRPEMKQFAQSIIEVQSAEIEQMQDWLKVWYPGRSSNRTYSPMMRDLSQLSGNALDQAFLDDMIGHHMEAVMMSQMLLNRNLVENWAIVPFARQIVRSQHQEIAQMRTWLQSWYGITGRSRMGYGLRHSSYLR